MTGYVSGPATIALAVVAPPVASDQSVTATEGSSQPIALSSTDPNNDSLNYTITTQPRNGQLSGSGANLTYTSNVGFTGNDSFQFTVTDTITGFVSNVATVTLDVVAVQAPDLIVQSGSLSVQPNSPHSGGQVTVTWNDQNIGNADVNSSFDDYVLVQKVNADGSLTYVNDGFVSGDSSLAAGAISAVQSFSFTMPDGPAGAGNFQVTVTTDYGQSVKEYDSIGDPAYDNNTVTTAFTSLQIVVAAVKIKQEPTDVAAGLTIQPPITVQVVDSSGNLVTNSSDPVTLSLGTNPGGATLGGTLTVHAINGVATFSDITLNQIGTGYTLTASSGNLTADTPLPST